MRASSYAMLCSENFQGSDSATANQQEFQANRDRDRDRAPCVRVENEKWNESRSNDDDRQML